MSKIPAHPVEGIIIPKASRILLTAFWQTYPKLRKECLRKYGFDPITEEAAYWRFGLAEPDHRTVLRDLRRNDGRFTPALVRRWELEELEASG